MGNVLETMLHEDDEEKMEGGKRYGEKARSTWKLNGLVTTVVEVTVDGLLLRGGSQQVSLCTNYYLPGPCMRALIVLVIFRAHFPPNLASL